MSQGRRLTWPSEKATSCRLSTTRKSQKPSASSLRLPHRRRSFAETSQWTDFPSGTWPRPSTNAMVNECSRSWWLWLRVWSSPSVGCSRAGWHSAPASVSCRRHSLGDSHKDLLPCWVARLKAVLWLLWSLDWNRLGFNSTKTEVTGEWGVPNCILLLIILSANCVKSASKLKKYANCEMYCWMCSEQIIEITGEQNNLPILK